MNWKKNIQENLFIIIISILLLIFIINWSMEKNTRINAFEYCIEKGYNSYFDFTRGFLSNKPTNIICQNVEVYEIQGLNPDLLINKDKNYFIPIK